MTRIAVLLCGFIGIALVGRSAMFYRATDKLSFGLALLIGAGLMVGLVELLSRASRAERLMGELRTKAPESLDGIEQTGGELKTLLRRRLAGNAVQIPAAWFTTYLLGLLVMVGMLGTFLGLFESLRGAREALTSSGDMDALRAALVSPLQGLSRAFGLSAAGVSASATLGLAAVFARRAESRLVDMVNAAVAGPLASWTAAGRQLKALEMLASHGPDLAASAAALQEATRQLEALRSDLVTCQQRAADKSADAIRATAVDVRGDIQSGIARAACATEAAVGPLFDRLADRAGEAAHEHLSRWSDRLEQEAHTREIAHARHLEQVQQALAQAAQSVSDDVRPGVQRLERQLAATFEELADRLRDLAKAQQGGFAATEAGLRSLADESSERLQALSTTSSAQLDSLHEAASARADALDSRQKAQVDGLGRHLKEILESTSDAERVRAEAVSREVERLLGGVAVRIEQWLAASAATGELITRRHDEAAGVVRDRLDRLVQEVRSSTSQLAADEHQRAAMLHEHLERTARAVEAAASSSAQADVQRVRSLRDTAEQVRQDLERSAEAGQQRTEQIASAVERFANALDQVELSASARMHTQVDRLVGSMAEHVARLETDHLAHSKEAAASLERLDGVLALHLDKLGQGLAVPLAEVVRSAREAPEAAARLVESARQSLEQSQMADSRREQQADALMSRLAEASQSVTRAATSQGERMDVFLQAAERRAELGQTQSEQRLGALLEHMQSLLDQQADRMAGFELRLESSRTEHANVLSQRLVEHARVLGESLTATGTVVREAADLVRAGGAEMSAVAEMFTAAVDQYRAASDRLIGGLGPIEEAIERAGQRDTVDLLGAYLDQTREVFDSSLRFQRELFTELRALRAARSPADA